ncbi:MAG: class I SAM-dependent RNA methyltransferase, partial [Syntrophomonadaceae bacterium]
RDLIDHEQPLGIMGFDIDKEVISLARYHVKQCGLQNGISLQCQPVSKLRSKYNYGYIICNPPYGERLAAKDEVEALYRQMGTTFSNLSTWSYYVLTSNLRLEKLFGRRADKKRKLYNGRIQCNLYQFFGPKPTILQGPFAKPAQE